MSTHLQAPIAIVLMGVSGSGKTTIGTRLADVLGWDFMDGDDFHPPDNVDKMARGVPLTDDDRWPWLEAIRDFLQTRLRTGEPVIVACSALKAAYRDVLRGAGDDLCFVFLQGPPALIERRLSDRKGHFFDPDLLASQFEALEVPTGDDVLTVSIAPSPETIVNGIIDALPGCGATAGD